MADVDRRPEPSAKTPLPAGLTDYDLAVGLFSAMGLVTVGEFQPLEHWMDRAQKVIAGAVECATIEGRRMADACPTCHGSLETWDGRRRWTCRRCTGVRHRLPARVSVPTFVEARDWPAFRDAMLARARR